MSADRLYINRAVADLHESPEQRPIACVKLTIGEDKDGNPIVFLAGDPSNGRTIEVENPWGSQEMADNILAAIQGYAYKPYTATGAHINPVVELGDAVNVGDIYSVVADSETTFSPLMTSTIAAPEDSVIDHEYPYESAMHREIARAKADVWSNFTVDLNKIKMEVGDLSTNEGKLSNRVATLEITADSIKQSVSAVQSKYVVPSSITQYDVGDGDPEKHDDDKIGSWYLNATNGTLWQREPDGWKQNRTLDKTDADIRTAIDQLPNEIMLSVSESYESKEAATGMKRDITEAYQAAIQLQADRILQTVAGATSKYDVSSCDTGYPIFYGYGGIKAGDDLPAHPAGSNPGAYYCNLNDGSLYRVVNGAWTSQGRKLPLITANLQSEISQTPDSIMLRVSEEIADAVRPISAKISMIPSLISLSVQGTLADEWVVQGRGGQGSYYADDIVKVSTVDENGILTAVDFYQARVNVPTTSAGYVIDPPSYPTYWEKINPPSVTSSIDVDLSGITISYDWYDPSASGTANSAYITLTKDGTTIGGGLVVMGNVAADTIAANTSITSPYIYDTNKTVRLTMDGNNPGSGILLSLYTGDDPWTQQPIYYPYFKIARVNGQTWFIFDDNASGPNRANLIYSPNGDVFSCSGNWTFDSLNATSFSTTSFSASTINGTVNGGVNGTVNGISASNFQYYSGKILCTGTWDFSGATVILPE